MNKYKYNEASAASLGVDCGAGRLLKRRPAANARIGAGFGGSWRGNASACFARAMLCAAALSR